MSKLPMVLYSLLLLFWLNIFIVTASCSDLEGKTSETNDTILATTKKKPLVIWFHNCASVNNDTLRIILKCDLINCVMVTGMHRSDLDWKKNIRVKQAVNLVKNSDAKLIWCRSLWPWYNIRNSKPQDLFSSEYYIRQILSIRAEAKEMGADYVAFDAEPYAKSPMKQYMRSKKRLLLDEQQRQQLKQVIRQATDVVGQIDFILPAGSISPIHPYNFLADLGKIRISEHTYYDNMSFIKNIRYPYEIFGAFVNPTKENKHRSEAPFFLPDEIFKKSNLWKNKKGVLIYTSSKKSPEVAQSLNRFSHTPQGRTIHNSLFQDPNSAYPSK